MIHAEITAGFWEAQVIVTDTSGAKQLIIKIRTQDQ